MFPVQLRGICWAACVLALATAPVRAVPAWGDVPAVPPPDPSAAVTTQPDQPRAYKRGFVIPIKDEITDVTLDVVSRRIDQVIAAGGDLIVFEMNTPGGILYTTREICTKIKNLKDVHTVAWINPSAFSAGAIIALACDEIVVAGRSTIGDAQPIIVTPGGVGAVPEDIEAKVTSPLIEELRDSAKENGYDPTLCMALIRPEMEVYWLENTATGERRFVDRDGRDEYFGIQPAEDAPASRSADAESDGAATPAAATYRAGTRVSDAQSRTDWRYVRAAEPLTNVDQPIVSDRELLTMSQHEAIAFGFATVEINSLEELQQRYALPAPLERLGYSWSEHLVTFLSKPLVRGVLMVLIMMGAYTEFKSPGLGLPGLVAIVALILFLAAPYMTGLADITDILLIVVGIGLLLVEIFVIPGFGLAGIAGLLFIVVGVLMSFVPSELPGRLPALPSFNFQYTVSALQTGLQVIAGSLVLSLVGMVTLSRYLPRLPVLGRVIAPNPRPADIAPEIAHPFVARVGDLGRVEAALRPAGKGRFGDELVDIVSEGEFIDAGMTVRVIERRGNHIVVQRAEA